MRKITYAMMCHVKDFCKPTFIKDGKWGLTMWNYIKYINIPENATSFTEYKDTCTQQRT